MTESLNIYAIFETRLVKDPHGNYRRRGWWDRQTGHYLGKNRQEACDRLQCEFPQNYGTLHVT